MLCIEGVPFLDGHAINSRCPLVVYDPLGSGFEVGNKQDVVNHASIRTNVHYLLPSLHRES